MIVNNFNIFRIAILPDEAHPKLIIDADAVLAGAITLQCFKVVAGWRPQILKAGRGIDVAQLASADREQIGRETFRQPSGPNRCRSPIVKRPNHM